MLRLHYQESLVFYSDTGFMRLANRPGQLLIDAGCDRVKLLDLVARCAWTIPFPPGVDDFGIYSWLVAPDGSASYLISRDPVDFGLRLDHSQCTATRFHCPYELEPLTEFCWQTQSSLLIFDYAGRVRSFDSRLGIVYAAAEVLNQEPTKTYLDRFWPWGPFKGAYRGHGAYIMSRRRGFIGYLPPTLSPQDVLLALQGDEGAIDATHYRDNLFVCYEERVEQHAGGTTMRTAIETPPDRRLVGIDVVLVEEQPILCVLCVLKDQAAAQPNSYIELYRLTPRQDG